jgi:hypothetical protein
LFGAASQRFVIGYMLTRGKTLRSIRGGTFAGINTNRIA